MQKARFFRRDGTRIPPGTDEAQDAWLRLAAASRAARRRREEASDEQGGDPIAAPYGFSTRVVATWQAERRRRTEAGLPLALWEKLAFRGAFCAAILAGIVALLPASAPRSASAELIPEPLIGIPVPMIE